MECLKWLAAAMHYFFHQKAGPSAIKTGKNTELHAASDGVAFNQGDGLILNQSAIKEGKTFEYLALY
jgi:hypothetical protein